MTHLLKAIFNELLNNDIQPILDIDIYIDIHIDNFNRAKNNMILEISDSHDQILICSIASFLKRNDNHNFKYYEIPFKLSPLEIMNIILLIFHNDYLSKINFSDKIDDYIVIFFHNKSINITTVFSSEFYNWVLKLPEILIYSYSNSSEIANKLKIKSNVDIMYKS